MIVITDSSIIVSALISPKGTIANIFKSKSRLQFMAPSFLLDEVENHFGKILANSTLSRSELKSEFTYLKSKIKFIELEDIPKKRILQAIAIVQDIDIDDAFFVAINRTFGHKIWTTDRKLANGLVRKGYDICVTTTFLSKQLYKK